MRDQEDRPSRDAARSERGSGTPHYERGSRGGDWKGRRQDGGGGRGEGRAARDGEQDGRRSAGHSSANRPRLEDMDVFRLAHDLALRIHEISDRFPADERSRLAALLRRTAAEVPAQLAAGSSRGDRTEYRAGVTAARDLAAQAHYYLLLARDLGHLSVSDCADMREGYERVGRMLTRLAQALG